MKISIITINLNNLKGLEDTVKSVLNQTYKHIEYIIIDGASTDGSIEFIHNLEEEFYYTSSEPDSGVYNAMNKGLKQATGDYVLFLNSGDTLVSSDTLKRSVSFMKDGLDIYYGDVMRHYQNGTVVEKCYPENLTMSFFIDSALGHQAVFTKCALFDRYFYFNEDYKILADWDFLVYAIIKKNSSYAKLPLCIANYDMIGISSQESSKALMQEERQRTYSNHFSEYGSLFERWYFLEQLYKMHKLYRLKHIESSVILSQLHQLSLRVLSQIQKHFVKR